MITIDEKRAIMPKTYRASYNKAMAGKSRRAAMQSFCYECMGWVLGETTKCTDTTCPLYPYRPTTDVPPDSCESVPQS